jgi:hypothetical protein
MEKKMSKLLKKRRNGDGPYIIVEISGGMGKGIVANAVVSALKKQYPKHKIVVVTAWDSPFHGNPDIYRVYNFNQLSYFYDDFIFDDTKIMKIDPYLAESHIKQESHLIKTWCDLYDIPYNGEMPKLFLNPREIELIKDRVKPHMGKPIMVMHTNGGVSDPNNPSGNKSWARDIPVEIAQSIVNFYSKNYRILHIRTQNQPELKNVETVDLPQRELFALISISQKRLFIDSFSQHAAAALGLQSTVCWIANKPSVFGYEMHDNIFPNAQFVKDFNKYKYMDNYALDGQPHEFPFDKLNLFDVKEIADSLKKQK